MAGSDVLEHAREAFRGQSWGSAYAGFGAADDEAPLRPEDLEQYARAAYLVGEDERCVALLGRAFQAREGAGDAAGDDAFWIAFNLLNRGEYARAGGWLARAEQATADHAPDCVVRARLLVPSALQSLMQGDAGQALHAFGRAQEVGRRQQDPELLAIAGLGIGQAKISMGEVSAGLAKLDEVMVGVTAGEVSPIVAGIVYCAVIVACHQTYQPRRAAEWTRALSRWCAAQPDLVPFRGQCLVHRAQILALNGAWQEAMTEVRLACRRLSVPAVQPAAGAALYEQAELHRLRGELTDAEDAYRQADTCGHETQPGLALLRLVQGRADTAWAGLRRVLEEPGPDWDRPRLLAAAAEVALARRDVPAAREASDELDAVAAQHDTELLHAMAAQTSGSVLLAEGDPRAALTRLRRAWRLWQGLDAPYQCARVRLLQGRCCQELGDLDAAQMELRAAAEAFRALGAAPDLAGLERWGVSVTDGQPLTPREVQVLRTVATGKTNRAIAEELFLSEKTVARHLSNIFAKLDVSSRAAATAYAYEHDLL